MAHNHEQLERAHSICLASHQRIIAAIEFSSEAHELLCSPHTFKRVTSGIGKGFTLDEFIHLEVHSLSSEQVFLSTPFKG